MNFSAVDLDDDTKAFWAECRAFFETHVTADVHEEERRTGGGFNEAVHRAMGERGWLTPHWPVEEGGAALDPVRERIVRLEFARSGAPAILSSTTILPTLAIRMFANDALKADVVPAVARGDVRICLGYTEPDCGSDLAAVRTRAVRDGDEWVISGQKMFTTGAQFCQYCFCLTRTDPDAPKHKGLTVFLVPLDAPGVEITPIGTLGGERTNFVHFDDVRVSDHFRIGPVDDGWTVVSAPLAREHGEGAEDDGGPGAAYSATSRRVIDALVPVLRDQRDVDGRSLFDSTAIQERLARIELDVEVSRVAPGPMGRILAVDLLVRDMSDVLELVGPAGVLSHGADGAVAGGVAEYGFRFAPGTTIYGGSTDIARNYIAERVLGLPRSTPRS